MTPLLDRLPVRRLGPEGRPLALLHGFGLTERTYRNALHLLAERRHVVFPSWTELAGRWDYDVVVAAIADLVEDAGGHATVVGHSFGGGLALSLAARRPDLVAELVIVDSIGLTERWQLTRNALIPGDHLYRMFTYRAAVDFFQTAHRRPANLARAGWAGFVRHKRGEVTAVSQLAIPKHVLWSERDLLLRVEDGREFADDIAATFHVVREPEAPGPVDHDWAYRHPDLLLRELERLALVPPRGSHESARSRTAHPAGRAARS